VSGGHDADRVLRASRPRRLEVVGAGPAGLAAAITAARAELSVVVHESAPSVGSRFHGDFQGLENWTREVDVLEELTALGIEPGSSRRWRFSRGCSGDAEAAASWIAGSITKNTGGNIGP